MRKFNEMREWHHVNLRSTANTRTIPNNELRTGQNNESFIRYNGSEKEILDIGRGLPGCPSSSASWLVKVNWWRIFPVLAEPGFRWVTNKEGLGLRRIIDEVVSNFPNDPVSFLEEQHDNEQLNQEEKEEKEQEEEEVWEEEEWEEEEEGEEDDSMPVEDDIVDWLDY